MAETVFLIKRDRIDDDNMSMSVLNRASSYTLREIADYEITPQDAVECLTGVIGKPRPVGVNDDFDSKDYHFFYRHEDDDNTAIVLYEDDSFDVYVNQEVQVHIKRNDVGYSFDYYKYKTDEELSDDNHDFDDDFIKGDVIHDDELADPAIVTITTMSVDGTDRVVEDEWTLSGLRLTSDFDTFIVKDKDILVDTILNNVSDNVVSIKIDDETIYE